MYCCQKTWACFFLFVCYDSNILHTLFAYKHITYDNFWICLLNTKSFYHGPIEGDIYSWTSNIGIYFEHQYLQVFGDFSCTLRPNYHFLITVWKAYFLTLQTSLNHLSCKLIALLLLVWLWHILVSGQQQELNMSKKFITYIPLACLWKWITLDKVIILRHILFTT